MNVTAAPATNGRVERLQSVGTHDNDGGEIARCQVVHASDQSVHSSAVFMVHLPKFAGLRQRISLVNQENNAGIVFTSAPCTSLWPLVLLR